MTTEPLAASSSVDEAAGEHERSEEVDVEHLLPDRVVGVDGVEPLAAFELRRNPGIVDERMKLAMDAPLDLADRLERVFGIGEVDLDVILGAGLPRAVLREGMARAGDDAPAGRREALDRRMADAAARPGEEQRAARLVGGRGRHGASIRSILKQLYRRFHVGLDTHSGIAARKAGIRPQG